MGTVREIGSEFWEIEKQNKSFFLLGRTALEYIIRDAYAETGMKLVLLPSFCCHSMIEPFMRHRFQIRYYDVIVGTSGLEVKLPEEPYEDEILLVLRYFGYSKIRGYDQIAKWNCVIEDYTHMCFSSKRFREANYRFGSYRKWSGFTGVAVAEKMNVDFIAPILANSNEKYFDARLQAQILKKNYVETGVGEKEKFLELYAKAEELVEKDYVDCVASLEEIRLLLIVDQDKLINRRRCNAEHLINGIKEIPGISLIWDKLEDEDVPLCVPILLDEQIRDELRRYLISQNIYCPIHWPLSELHEGISQYAVDLYKRELSLICDQRYDIQDIDRMIECIKNFMKEYMENIF